MGMFHVGIVGVKNPEGQPDEDPNNGDRQDFESF